MTSVAIVGSRPTAIYALKKLVELVKPLRIVIYERTGSTGTGSPYRRGTNGPSLLANIASVELPPVLEPLHDWLNSRSDSGMEALAIDARDVTDRAFFPRVAIGAYFRDQLFRLAELAVTRGHSVDIRPHHEILDVVLDAVDGASVSGRSASGLFSTTFDHVLIATGHSTGDPVTAGSSYHDSPYPTERLECVPAKRVGILGTSLSGIDAALTVALAHGSFVEQKGGMSCVLKEGAEKLRVTMMSRAGILPEADFYCPIPYEPLSIFTAKAVADLIAGGAAGLLDRTVDLFKQQLFQDDPSYAAKVGLNVLNADSFPEAYFSSRATSDPFEWAAINLAEVEANHRDRRTVAWRYAILRMHEEFEAVVRHLDDGDRARFDRGIKKVFVDNYAAIPPLSIRRLIALHEAGVLQVTRLGSDYELSSEDGCHLVVLPGRTLPFDILIDATGQGATKPTEFPLPSLRERLKAPDGVRALQAAGVHIAALPFLMGDRPFIQGLVTCCEVGETVADAVASAVSDNGLIDEAPAVAA